MNQRSVCFFMLYHKRPELTRMSMWHMAKVIKMFNEAGHKAQGIVIGDDPMQAKYAESLGLEHFKKENEPLYRKFAAGYQVSLAKDTDYVCKMDSNNFNSEEYWKRCIEAMGGDKKASFGTNRFTVMSADPEKEETCIFKTRKSIHLCNSGQFYLNWTLTQGVDFNRIYKPNMKSNFDGSINDKITSKWGDDIVFTISSHPDDCFDVKDGDDIHSYRSYITKSPNVYPANLTRSELKEKYEELRLLDEGFFSLENDKIVEPGAEPSE